jgi:hypothetical protein
MLGKKTAQAILDSDVSSLYPFYARMFHFMELADVEAKSEYIIIVLFISSFKPE